jgi:hypothetical protein
MIHNSRFNIKMLHRYFFYLLIILLPTQLGLHFWPEWSHVLGRRIDYLSPTLFLTDVLVLLTLGSWLIEIGFRKANYELGIMNYGKKNITIIHASLFILLFVILNTVFSLSPSISINSWCKVFEFGLLSVYIGVTKPSRFRIQLAVTFAVFYSSLVAIVQFLFQHSIGGPFWFLGERSFSSMTGGIAQYSWCYPLFTSGCNLILRAYGTFPHPNVLGGFLAISIPFLLMHTKNSEPLREKIFRFVRFLSISLGIIALVLTFSRSAVLVGIIGTLFVFFNNRSFTFRYSTHFWKIVIGILAVLCMYVLFIVSDKSQESVAVRIALNQSAIDIWWMHPWLGVGLGNFIVALPSFLPAKFIYFLQPVHNIYLYYYLS